MPRPRPRPRDPRLDEEILLQPSDTLIIQGTNLGWSNRSDAPCLMLGSMIDALPKEPSQ